MGFDTRECRGTGFHDGPWPPVANGTTQGNGTPVK